MPNIHQIYIRHKNFQFNVVISSIPFYHFVQMINSCVVWSSRCCNLNFYFLNFNSDNFIKH